MDMLVQLDAYLDGKCEQACKQLIRCARTGSATNLNHGHVETTVEDFRGICDDAEKCSCDMFKVDIKNSADVCGNYENFEKVLDRLEKKYLRLIADFKELTFALVVAKLQLNNGDLGTVDVIEMLSEKGMSNFD